MPEPTSPAGVDPQPVPTPTDPRVGPYDLQQDGHCALGHPLNGFGRCNELNTGLEAGGQ